MPPAHTPLSPPKSPPLPPSLPNELLNLVQSLTRRLDDVNHHQLPQLAACQGPLSLHNELAANVRSELAGAKADFEVTETYFGTVKLDRSELTEGRLLARRK